MKHIQIRKTMRNGEPYILEYTYPDMKKVWAHCPLESDVDKVLPIDRYPKGRGVPLGTLFEQNPDYCKWLVRNSALQTSYKKAILRIWGGKPYVKPDNEIPFDEDRSFVKANWDAEDIAKDKNIRLHDTHSN